LTIGWLARVQGLVLHFFGFNLASSMLEFQSVYRRQEATFDYTANKEINKK
jgi:hypothetical protein